MTGWIPSPAANRRCWTAADGVHIDVRGMPPPEPMVSIVELIESLPHATAVIVHHERDPVMLYAELAERGWTAEQIEGDPGEFRLRLARAAQQV